MLPLRALVDLGTITMKGCSTFPKAPASLEPHNQIVWCHIQDTHWGALPLWGGTVGVFYSPSRLGNKLTGSNIYFVNLPNEECSFVLKSSTRFFGLFVLFLVLFYSEVSGRLSLHTSNQYSYEILNFLKKPADSIFVRMTQIEAEFRIRKNITAIF